MSKRKLREILRYHFEHGLSREAIARALCVAKGSVTNVLQRFQAAELTWPVAPEWSDAELEARLYRGDGLRAWKESGEATTYYLYDGETLVAEMDGDGDVTAVHVWGADGLVSRGDVFYLYDPLGNVAHRLDATGALLSSDAYDAWGALVASKDPQGNAADLSDEPYGYKAQYGYFTDRETGLVLCTHRYYDPEYGRWVTRDPIGYDGGNNLYTYCGNSPFNYSDPSGLERILLVIGDATLDSPDEHAKPSRRKGTAVAGFIGQQFSDYYMSIVRNCHGWGEGDEVVVLRGAEATPEKVFEELKKSDGFIYYGHGMDGCLYPNASIELSPNLLSLKKKLNWAYIGACYSNTQELKEALVGDGAHKSVSFKAYNGFFSCPFGTQILPQGLCDNIRRKVDINFLRLPAPL